MRFFNTAGPINPADHYYVSGRLNEKEMKELIEDKKYFIMHAPRQSGKTTAFQDFVLRLNSEGKYTALYVNVENAQVARSNVEKGMFAIISMLKDGLIRIKEKESIISHIDSLLHEPRAELVMLYKCLSSWAEMSEKPIVLIIDEIDALVGDTLISVLRQLRSGYGQRPKSFPQAVCLIGVRDVRDYMIWSDAEQKSILGGPSRSLCEPPQGERLPIKSITNVYSESLVLPDFTSDQTKELLLQHTKATGQKFTDDAITYVFDQTQGQPWLTNALAYQACFRDVTDRSATITKEILEKARETLIKRQDTHLDVLINRLNEPRVCAVLDAIITGSSDRPSATDDDFKYVQDLGLIKISPTNMWISNPIYKEILPRALSDKFQKYMALRDGSASLLRMSAKHQ